jgi:hypothetical protein
MESVLLMVPEFFIFTIAGKMVLNAVPTCCSIGMSCFSKHSCILTGRLSNTYKMTNQSNCESTSTETSTSEQKNLDNAKKFKTINSAV